MTALEFDRRGAGGDWTVLLVHGLGGRRAQVEALAEELSRDASVVTVDLLGHGTSPVGPAGGTLRAQVEALAEVVAELAGPRLAVVGHSAGGAVCLRLSTSVPGIDSVTMLDTAIFDGESMVDWAAGLAADLARDGWTDTAQALHRASLGEWAGAALAEEVEVGIRATDPAAGAALMRDILTVDAVAEIRRSPARLCYVSAFRPIDPTRLLASRPDLEFHRVEQSGHWVQMEHPRLVGDIIRDHVLLGSAA
ncbi:hypothetical protein GCM10009836_54640 [Pseudonocardia ailaonensis]|uniref:AB hydrolase-1 domain-containing protein n=1 Tax=Pseudonocardia ailaonensis TaxID=367279 RepID=A0ABN2NFL7_9PSEU